MAPSLPEQIATVQNVLGKYVKKPALVDKHLTRPPFRFLHDIFVAVMNSTGFYTGLFTPGEIDYSGLNTKEEKSEFLTKVIGVTGLATGSEIDAKVGKILAGQDPEKTLEFLILLGKALDSGVSSKDAVATVLSGSSGGVGVDKKKSDGKSTKKSVKDKPSAGDPAATGKVKTSSEIKKSSGQPTAKPSPAQSQQKPTRQSDKEKANAKSISNSKKSPASKPTNSEEVKKESNVKGDDKRERSRSREQPKTQPSTSTRNDSKSRDQSALREASALAPLTRNVSKEDLNRKSENKTLQNSTEEQAVVTEIPTHDDEPLQKTEELDDLSLKNEQDSLQFMGEVETLLQEHGIQIDAAANKRRKSAESKAAAVGIETIAEKPLVPEKFEVTEDVRVVETKSSDQILIDSSPLLPPLTTKLPTITKPIVPPTPVPVPVPAPPVSDDSDVDTDDSEVGPLASSTTKTKAGPTRTGSSEGETARNAPPSAMRRPPSSFTRPTSARPAPPRPKTAIVEEETVYRPPTTKIPVILDSADVDEEESSESRKQGLLDLLAAQPMSTGPMGTGPGDMAGNDARGHLVQQIMDTKRELEASDKNKDDDMRDLHRQSQGELNALKGLIQTSARLANPLARILDFLQEDIDAMTSEYVKYQAEDKRLQELLEKEKEITRQRLKPKRLELMELMDKIEQQNFEIRAAHNDLQESEEHLRNYMTSIDAGPDRVDIPTRFLIKGDWEFDLELATEEHEELERKTKGRSGAFGSFPPFLCVSAEAREAEKIGGTKFNIPKPKRKTQTVAGGLNYGQKNFKKPIFAIDTNDDDGGSERRGFFTQGNKPRYAERRRSSQFLEPPEPELNSLEILSEN